MTRSGLDGRGFGDGFRWAPEPDFFPLEGRDFAPGVDFPPAVVLAPGVDFAAPPAFAPAFAAAAAGVFGGFGRGGSESSTRCSRTAASLAFTRGFAGEGPRLGRTGS
nr:hypothetical protein [Microbacterium bovistercoris]